MLCVDRLFRQMASGSPPVVWFHNGRPLSNEGKSAGGGQVQVQVEGDKSKWTTWTSRLRVSSAESADSGNYSCVPWRGKIGSVSVFVSQGKPPIYSFKNVRFLQRQLIIAPSIS
jgi:hypothetical protein